MGPKLRSWLRGVRLGLTRLEDRCLPAAVLKATFAQGVLRIEGTDGPDTIRLRQLGSTFTVDGVAGKFKAAQVHTVQIAALGGNDVVDLRGGSGADAVVFNGVQVDGGAGTDTLAGGPGRDQLFGGDGGDQLFGLGAADYLDGGAGDDSLIGGDAGDTLYGDLGDDELFGEAGDDRLGGGDGADYLGGNDGADWLDGSRGRDTLAGDAGADLLYDAAAGNSLTADGHDRRYAGHFAWFDLAFGDSGLRSEARWRAADGLLDREDVLRIFDRAEPGGVSAAEFADLRTMVTPDWSLPGNVPNIQWYGMADHVLKLATYVAFGDPANARYQGQALGNLRAGSSADHLDKLVGKWFLGLDRPRASSAATYRAVSGALFQGGGPEYRDADQGNVGDCYLIASLAEMAQHAPQAIRDMFTDNGDGTWTARFLVNGGPRYVTVDRFLPVNSSGRTHYADVGGRYDSAGNELWVALAEKAYAQLNESGGLGQDNTNSYGGIDGGYADLAMQHITGRPGSWTWLSYSNEGQVIHLAQSGLATVLASKQSNPGNGVAQGHAYALLGYSGTTRRFSLYNPWGSTIELTWGQIQQSFNGYWQMS